ncbi:hypothetical protein [Microbacterium hominis]|uniref:Uncharacterized protein n=1 Tax=Microbacterium hominis TaxID=162426 RepID=A0A2K9D9I7_9MICO|nr:hypothetical protein [Microbacterium hominis]AUG29542.1 hypothetical protein CXR34_08840 [Microbacterium hominis]
MVSMSTPSPADLLRRQPAGSPGGRGGQFQEKSNDAPANPLAAGSATSPDDLPIPDLVEELPAWVSDAAAQLTAEYRDLWKRMNAKHRSSTYGAAAQLSVQSEDPAELAILGQFQGPGIALNVARNPATPGCVLHMIAVGESEWRDPEARRAAVVHPNCPETTIRIIWAHRNVLDYPGVGKAAISTAPNTPFDVLDEAAAEGDMTALARLESATG